MRLLSYQVQAPFQSFNFFTGQTKWEVSNEIFEKIVPQGAVTGSLDWFPEEPLLFGRESSTYRGEQTSNISINIDISIISNIITIISIFRSSSPIIINSKIKTSIYNRLALNTMTLQVTSVNVNSGQGVAISVTGIAQVPQQWTKYRLHQQWTTLMAIFVDVIKMLLSENPKWNCF